MLLQLEPLFSPTLIWTFVCAILAGGWVWRELVWKRRFTATRKQLAAEQQQGLQARRRILELEFQRDWLDSLQNTGQGLGPQLELLTRSFPTDPQRALWTIERTGTGESLTTVALGVPELLTQIATTQQLWQQLETTSSVQFDPANPRQSRLLRWPSKSALPPLRLLILRCGSERTANRLLCTTHLPAWTTDEQTNLQLLEWACLHWNPPPAVPTSMDQVASDEEVRMVRIMLELRTIADMDFPSPMEMLREFLRTLARATGYERVALFLTRHDDPQHIERFCHSSPQLSADIAEQWQQQEQTLVQQHRNDIDLALLDENALATNYGNLPLKSCALSALIPGADPIGYLCLTSRTALKVHTQDQQIITWAARFLLQTLSKTVDRVVVEEQARRDALTRLANRHSFDSELQRQLKVAAATDELCSLIMLDLDHFKKINDTYGHPAGDAVLKEAARRIEDVIAQTRVADRPLVARLGGEELAVLLPGVGHAGALRIAEAIRHAIRDLPVQHEGQKIEFTTSIGVAVCPRNGRTANELITAADAALYAAKTAGRDRVHTAAPIDIARPVAPARDAR
ncbi:MAG: GGDEF domain-containing protein [Planctomycetaceae bacterium]|nr:GGDEF domain-containing protein [Planctomycetaceae bacterium]